MITVTIRGNDPMYEQVNRSSRTIVLIGSFIVNEAAGMASMHALVPTYFTG